MGWIEWIGGLASELGNGEQKLEFKMRSGGFFLQRIHDDLVADRIFLSLPKSKNSHHVISGLISWAPFLIPDKLW